MGRLLLFQILPILPNFRWMYWIWLVHWCWCHISILVCELESCDLESWVQKARIHCAPACIKFFLFFLNPSSLVHPILVYHNFKIKSNLLAQWRSTCRVKSDPNYIPQTFHSGTNFSPVKIWQACLLWICLSICLSIYLSVYLPICLSRTGGSLVPNQSPLQTESQSKTYTPGLWFSGAAWISVWKILFAFSKLDNSKIWQRRSVFIMTERAAGIL